MVLVQPADLEKINELNELTMEYSEDECSTEANTDRTTEEAVKICDIDIMIMSNPSNFITCELRDTERS